MIRLILNLLLIHCSVFFASSQQANPVVTVSNDDQELVRSLSAITPTAFATLEKNPDDLDAALELISGAIARPILNIVNQFQQEAGGNANAVANDISSGIAQALSSVPETSDFSNIDVDSIGAEVISTVEGLLEGLTTNSNAAIVFLDIVNVITSAIGNSLAEISGGQFNFQVTLENLDELIARAESMARARIVNEAENSNVDVGESVAGEESGNSTTNEGENSPDDVDQSAQDLSSSVDVSVMADLESGDNEAVIQYMSEMFQEEMGDSVADLFSYVANISELNTSMSSVFVDIFSEIDFQKTQFTAALGKAYEDNPGCKIMLAKAIVDTQASNEIEGLVSMLATVLTEPTPAQTVFLNAIEYAIEIEGCEGVLNVLLETERIINEDGNSNLLDKAIDNNQVIFKCFEEAESSQKVMSIVSAISNSEIEEAYELITDAKVEDQTSLAVSAFMVALQEGYLTQLAQLLVQYFRGDDVSAEVRSYTIAQFISQGGQEAVDLLIDGMVDDESDESTLEDTILFALTLAEKSVTDSFVKLVSGSIIGDDCRLETVIEGILDSANKKQSNQIVSLLTKGGASICLPTIQEPIPRVPKEQPQEEDEDQSGRVKPLNPELVEEINEVDSQTINEAENFKASTEENAQDSQSLPPQEPEEVVEVQPSELVEEEQAEDVIRNPTQVDEEEQEEQEEGEGATETIPLQQAEELEDPTDVLPDEIGGLGQLVPASTRGVQNNELPTKEDDEEEAGVIDPTMPLSSSATQVEEVLESSITEQEEDDEEEVLDDDSLLPSLPLGLVRENEEQIIPLPEVEDLTQPLIQTGQGIDQDLTQDFLLMQLEADDDEEEEEEGTLVSNQEVIGTDTAEINQDPLSSTIVPQTTLEGEEEASQPLPEELPIFPVPSIALPQRRQREQNSRTPATTSQSQEEIPLSSTALEDEEVEELPIPALIRATDSSAESNQFPAPMVLIPSPRQVVIEEEEEEEEQDKDASNALTTPQVAEQEVVRQTPQTPRGVPSAQVAQIGDIVSPTSASSEQVDPTAPPVSLSSTIQEELVIPPQADFIFTDAEVLPLKSKQLIQPLVEPLVEEVAMDQTLTPLPVSATSNKTLDQSEEKEEDVITIRESTDDEEDTSPKEAQVEVGSDEFFQDVLSQIMKLPPPVLPSPDSSPSPVVLPPTQTFQPSPPPRSTVSSSSSVSIGAITPISTQSPTIQSVPTSVKPPPTQATSQSSVDYGECIDIPPKGTILTCKEQYEFGKCGREWMKEKNYCAKTCGYCPTTCTNIQPNGQYTCDQQALFGKCSEEWLQEGGYCKASCGVCGSRVVDETAVLQSLGHCIDIQPKGEHTCEEQSNFGKCDAEWMVAGQFCQKTCNRCDS